MFDRKNLCPFVLSLLILFFFIAGKGDLFGQTPVPDSIPLLRTPPVQKENSKQAGSSEKKEGVVLSGTPVQDGSAKEAKPLNSKPLPEKPSLESLVQGSDYLTSREGIFESLKVLVVLTIVSLVPAIFLMTTSFIRIITVLSILRQGLGTGQMPPNQVITALSVFLTLLIMMPVWTDVYKESLLPYSQKKLTPMEAYEKGQLPIRTFLWKQIERTGNTDDIWLFMRYVPDAKPPEYYEDIPWTVLLPAFMLSELKTAFLIGFQIFLPFVIIDMVVAAVMVSMGMMMLPPMMISLPFKILLFVLMDGWTLVAKMLLDSFLGSGTGG